MSARALATIAVAASILGPAWAFGQSVQERIKAAASLAPDLELPPKASSLSFFSTPQMALYKPDGAGPFPALVLLHQCGGLASRNWQNASMLQWAREALARGYAVLVLDSLGSRGVDTVCYGAKGGVNLARGLRDALQAAEHLRKFDFVDKARVAMAGFSWGAMNGLLASSRIWGSTLAAGERFAAVVSFYPGCFTVKPPAGGAFELVNPDIDRPLLVLMGGEDTETPPAECMPKLEAAKAAGAPVEWHVYPASTHCWDCKNLHNFSKTDFRGNAVVYRYDAKVTEDSARRMFEFLEKVMPKPQP
jgi:dienelactone hydrolase